MNDSKPAAKWKNIIVLPSKHENIPIIILHHNLFLIIFAKNITLLIVRKYDIITVICVFGLPQSQKRNHGLILERTIKGLGDRYIIPNNADRRLLKNIEDINKNDL